MSKFMSTLGFSRLGYIVQGGDLGGATAPVAASIDPTCKLVDVNQLNMVPPPGVNVEADVGAGKYAPDEVESFQNTMEFAKRGAAFIEVDSTRATTAGLVIGSTPVSLLAWVGEKIISSTNKTPETDSILTNLYIATERSPMGLYRSWMAGNLSIVIWIVLAQEKDRGFIQNLD